MGETQSSAEKAIPTKTRMLYALYDVARRVSSVKIPFPSIMLAVPEQVIGSDSLANVTRFFEKYLDFPGALGESLARIAGKVVGLQPYDLWKARREMPDYSVIREASAAGAMTTQERVKQAAELLRDASAFPPTDRLNPSDAKALQGKVSEGK